MNLQFLIEFTFEINLFSVFAFLGGIIAGFILFGLIYLISVIISLRKSKIHINKELKNISQKDIQKIIHKYQDAFKDENKRRKAIPYDYFIRTIYEMMNEIASLFYPKAKRPLLELSIDEFILLDKYIIKKIEELLSGKMFGLVKRLKVSTIMSFVDKKNAFDNIKVVKTVKKYRLQKVVDILLTALNILNPKTWLQKFIIRPITNVVTKYLFTIIYAYIGEETYQVYSKQAFTLEDERLVYMLNEIANEEKEIDPSLENKVIEEIIKK